MVVASEQKTMLVQGGIAEQPAWFVSMLAWFAPAYDMLKFMARAKMILGDDVKNAVNKQGGAFGKQKKA